jgi:hypothetical protein
MSCEQQNRQATTHPVDYTSGMQTTKSKVLMHLTAADLCGLERGNPYNNTAEGRPAQRLRLQANLSYAWQQSSSCCVHAPTCRAARVIIAVPRMLVEIISSQFSTCPSNKLDWLRDRPAQCTNQQATAPLSTTALPPGSQC